MIFTAPIARSAAVQRAAGTGITFTNGSYRLLATNTSPPGALTGFRDEEINADCEYSHLLALGFSSTPSAVDVEIATGSTDGDLLLIALYIDGDSNSRIAIRERKEGSSTWSAWKDYTPPIGSDSPTGDHALVRDYPELLITESDLGNNATLPQIVQSNPRFFRGGGADQVLLAYRDYGVFVPIEYQYELEGFNVIVEYGLRGFSLSPTETAYRADNYQQTYSGSIPSCDSQNIADSTNPRVFCFNNAQNTGLPTGANWGLAYFHRTPDRITTWDGLLGGETRSNGAIYLDERREMANGHLRALLPRTMDPTAVEIRLSSADQVLLDYAIFTKVGAVLHPAPALQSPRLAHDIKRAKGSSGKYHVTSRSPDPLFQCRFRPPMYEDTDQLEDVAALDGAKEFGLFPSGLASAYTGAGTAAYRRPEFSRNCSITDFTGWRGVDGIDTAAGWTGSLGIQERA